MFVVVLVVCFAVAGGQGIVKQINRVAHHLSQFGGRVELAVEPEGGNGAQGCRHCVAVAHSVKWDAKSENKKGMHQPSGHKKEIVNDFKLGPHFSVVLVAVFKITVHIFHVDVLLMGVHSPADPSIAEAIISPGVWVFGFVALLVVATVFRGPPYGTVLVGETCSRRQ